MTTQYAILIRNTLTRTSISFDELFDGRLERWDVSADKAHRCLVDCVGRWVNFDSEGGSMVDGFWHPVSFRRDAVINSIMGDGHIDMRGPRPQDIIDAITREFNVDIYSEHEPQYWGCETQAELEWSMAEFNRRLDEVAAAGPPEADPGATRGAPGDDLPF
jgi:hypothetical protein